MTQSKIVTVSTLLGDIIRELAPEHPDLAQLADEMLAEADWLLHQYQERVKSAPDG